MKCDISLR